MGDNGVDEWVVGDGGGERVLSLGGQWEGGGTHTHTSTHQQPAFGHRDASEQVGSNGMREGNAHLTPHGGSACAHGGFASIRLPAPPWDDWSHLPDY